MGEREGLQGTLKAAAASQQMFTELKSFLSSELNAFKEEIKRQNDDSIHSAVKKLKHDQSVRHSFKSKGNEEQFHHEEKVARRIDNGMGALQSGKFLEVRDALEEGKSLVATRMKHIVLADLHG